MSTVKAPREAFTTPRSAIEGKPTEARAADAQHALSQALKAQRKRGTREMKYSDHITMTEVRDFGAKGWGLTATVEPKEYAPQAIGEAKQHLSNLGFANVHIEAEGGPTKTILHPLMQKPQAPQGIAIATGTQWKSAYTSTAEKRFSDGDYKKLPGLDAPPGFAVAESFSLERGLEKWTIARVGDDLIVHVEALPKQIILRGRGGWYNCGPAPKF